MLLRKTMKLKKQKLPILAKKLRHYLTNNGIVRVNFAKLSLRVSIKKGKLRFNADFLLRLSTGVHWYNLQ